MRDKLYEKKKVIIGAVLVMWLLALCPIPNSFESQGIQRRQRIFPRFSCLRAYTKVLPMAHPRHWVGEWTKGGKREEVLFSLLVAALV